MLSLRVSLLDSSLVCEDDNLVALLVVLLQFVHHLLAVQPHPVLTSGGEASVCLGVLRLDEGGVLRGVRNFSEGSTSTHHVEADDLLRTFDLVGVEDEEGLELSPLQAVF